MKNLFVLAVLVAAASAMPSELETLKDNEYATGRIINGEDATISQVPYQVSIELNDSHNCGGSIIAELWILTAAHCVTYPAFRYKVRAGSDTPNYGGNLYDVADVYLHEQYWINSRGVPKNDIALLRLKKPIEINDEQKPVTLYDKDEKAEPGSYAVITGYGRTEIGKLATVLKIASVPVIDKQECFKAYLETFGGIAENQICAAHPNGGKDACAGDSGGPMTINGRLAGIISWGRECGWKGNPGVYTEVSKYHDWIAKTTCLEL